MQLSSIHAAKLPHKLGEFDFLFFCLYLSGRPVDELRELVACTWLTEGATSRSTAAGAVPAEAEVDAGGVEDAIVEDAGRFGTATGTLGLQPNGRVVLCRVVSCGGSSAA